MILGWVYDWDLGLHNGGQMLTARALLDGRPDWASVRMITPYHDEALGQCDAYIINQCRFFRLDQLARLASETYVWLFHDAMAMYAHQAILLRPLIQRATACVFKSPFHREQVVKRWPSAACPPGRVVYADVIPVDQFHDGPKTRDAIWLGNYVAPKGVLEAIDWAEENRRHLDMFGFGDPFQFGRSSPYVRMYPVLPYSEVPSVLRQYRTFVFLPTGPEAAARVVPEAVLSGCELVVNDNVGVTSFDWWTEDPDLLRKRLQDRSGEFWQALAELLEVPSGTNS